MRRLEGIDLLKKAGENLTSDEGLEVGICVMFFFLAISI